MVEGQVQQWLAIEAGGSDETGPHGKWMKLVYRLIQDTTKRVLEGSPLTLQEFYSNLSSLVLVKMIHLKDLPGRKADEINMKCYEWILVL